MLPLDFWRAGQARSMADVPAMAFEAGELADRCELESANDS